MVFEEANFTKLLDVGVVVVVCGVVVGNADEYWGVGVFGEAVLKMSFSVLFLAIEGSIITAIITHKENTSAINNIAVVTDTREQQSRLRFRNLVKNGLSSSSSISRNDL